MGSIPHPGEFALPALGFVYAAGRNVGWAQDGCRHSYLACSSLTFHGRLHMARLPSALQADSRYCAWGLRTCERSCNLRDTPQSRVWGDGLER